VGVLDTRKLVQLRRKMDDYIDYKTGTLSKKGESLVK